MSCNNKNLIFSNVNTNNNIIKSKTNLNYDYSQLDKEIDSYLKTNNLRPGPPRISNNRLLRKKNDYDSEVYNIKYNSFSINLVKNINWDK